jgi:hypothetical protein
MGGVGVIICNSGPKCSLIPEVASPLSVESDSLLLVSPLPDSNTSLASIKCASPSEAGLLMILPAERVLAADRALPGVSTEFTDSLDIRWIASRRGREAATAAAAASETS